MFYACGRNLNRKNENIDAKTYRKTASWLSLIENSRRTALVSAPVGTCHYVNLFFLLLSPPMTRKSFHLPHHGRFSSPLRSNRERTFLKNHIRNHILLISCFFPSLNCSPCIWALPNEYVIGIMKSIFGIRPWFDNAVPAV